MSQLKDNLNHNENYEDDDDDDISSSDFIDEDDPVMSDMIENVRSEKYLSTHYVLASDVLNKRVNDPFILCRSFKYMLISEINKLLGLKNSWDDTISINSKTVFKKWFIENMHRIKSAFSSFMTIGPKFTIPKNFKDILTILNYIYNS